MCGRGSCKSKTQRPGDNRVFRGKQVSLWRRLHGNRSQRLLLDAWKVILEEAGARTLPKVDQDDFDAKGHE